MCGIVFGNVSIPDCENNETKIDRNLRITSFQVGYVLFLAWVMLTFVNLCLHN